MEGRWRNLAGTVAVARVAPEPGYNSSLADPMSARLLRYRYTENMCGQPPSAINMDSGERILEIACPEYVTSSPSE